jgi:hypothetical protein
MPFTGVELRHEKFVSSNNSYYPAMRSETKPSEAAAVSVFQPKYLTQRRNETFLRNMSEEKTNRIA